MIIEREIDWMTKLVNIKFSYPLTDSYTPKVRELEEVVKYMFGEIIGGELWEHIKKYDAPTEEELMEKKLELGITTADANLVKQVLSTPINQCRFGKNTVCELDISPIWGEDLKFLAEFCKKNNYLLEIEPTCETYIIKIMKKHKKCSYNAGMSVGYPNTSGK